jgi:D-arabinono-1,4-lactone oxidase
MLHRKDYLFRNWAGNVSSLSENYYQPETEQDFISAVAESKKLRIVGTGHSWSDICSTSATLLSLDRYNRVLNLNKEQLQVTVQAGIKLWQLNEYLDKHGLALTNLGSIAKQSVAGAISTGTHGTGILFPVLAS